MLDKPKFLMVPPLYEERKATVSWENTADADMYELDIVYNETFDQASHGKSWGAIDGADWTWEDQKESNGKSWEQLAVLSAQGLMWRNIEFFDKTWAQWDADLEATWQWMEENSPIFTVYKGPGEDTPAPDQGLNWNTIEVIPWSWADQDGQNGLSWKELSLLPSVGLDWSQHDSNQLTWDEFENKYDSWGSFETQPARGLTWASLEARRLNWAGFESLGDNSDGLTWEQLEHLQPDNQTHKGCEIAIPLHSKWAMLRVRAVGNNDASEYLITGIVNIIPVFYREATLKWQAKAGTIYRILIKGRNIVNPYKIPLTFRYGAGILTLTDFMAQNSGKQLEPGEYPSANLRIDASSLGEVRFRCIKPITEGNSWSGCVTCIEVIANQDGMAEVSLL